MDVFSHGLWGAIVYGRQGNALAALAFGMAPDLISFGPHILINLLKGKLEKGKPELSNFPAWVFKTYDLTHSLVVYAGVYITLRAIFGSEVAYLSLAWLLHILMDIPTHSKNFFPTKFLYPLSNFHIDGTPWSSKGIMLGNFVFLLLAYGIYFAGLL